MSAMPIASPKSTFDLKTSVSHQLNQLINRGDGKIFYTVSGAESVENALKISRQITGREIVLARRKSYHGASLGALSVTGDWRNDPHTTFDSGTVRIPEHDEDPELERTRQIIQTTGPDNVAAIILETISGTNGMAVPPKSWFEGIESLCQEFGIMLIIDEVLVGFRRCGVDFAFHDYGITPDMVCMSKAISGGYIPFGAVWTSPAIATHYESETLCCGLTNYGHPLGLAALQAVLDLLGDPEFDAGMKNLESIFESELRRMGQRNDVTEIRIKGLMAAIYFDHPAPNWQDGFDAGLHIFGKENYSILAPPYISSPDRLQQAIETFAGLLP
jgi:taurine--2-oxoglutarate transaminase